MDFDSIFTMVIAAIFAISIICICVAIVKERKVRIAYEAELKKLLATPSEDCNEFDADNAPSSSTPLVLNHENWANFELSLKNLVEVIILSSVVEIPRNGLLKAVMGNFTRGVQYRFIVSGDRVETEVNGYYKIFEVIATTIAAKNNLKIPIKNLISISRLPDNWNNVPCVFYRFRESENPNSRIRTIAFRGDRAGVGIADSYIAIEHELAEALFTLLIGQPPEKIGHLIQGRSADTFPNPVAVVSQTQTATMLN